MHFLLVTHLLDGFVIDLVHGVVRHRRLADISKQGFHQHLVALEFDAVLDRVAVADLLLLSGLGQQDNVAEIRDEVVALLVWSHLRHVAADFILGAGEVALADINAVNAGYHGIGILRFGRSGRHKEERGKRERAEYTSGERSGREHRRDPLADRHEAGFMLAIGRKLGGPGRRGHSPNRLSLAMAELRLGPDECVNSRFALTGNPPPPISR